jgi:hypothetical protein
MDFNNDNTWSYWTKLPPQTHIPGVNYSPLMVEIKVEALVSKKKRRPEAILVAVPPPIFLR